MKEERNGVRDAGLYPGSAVLSDGDWEHRSGSTIPSAGNRDQIPGGRRRRRRRILSVLTDLYVVLMYTIFYIPVAVMIVFSFNDAKRNFSWEGFTTSWYTKLFSFSNTTLWDALIYSLVIAVLATVISTVIGVLGGIGLKKFEFRAKKFINMMIYVPIIVPEIVLAVAMLIIFITFGIKMGMGTILVGHCTFCIPYAVVTIKGRISGDNETLEEASMDLGANRLQTFWRVTIPSIMPGIMSSAFLCFTLSIDDVVMSNMLAGASQSTLPVLILSLNRTGLSGDVNALTTVMIVMMAAAVFMQNLITGRMAKRRQARLSRETV